MIFRIKTFIINIIGCFVIGCIAAFTSKELSLSPKLVLFLKVGVCGGFTTFSTFALETSDLMKNSHTGTAFLYVILSIVAGICVIFAAQAFINRYF